jgi:hypothetical protein
MKRAPRTQFTISDETRSRLDKEILPHGRSAFVEAAIIRALDDRKDGFPFESQRPIPVMLVSPTPRTGPPDIVCRLGVSAAEWLPLSAKEKASRMSAVFESLPGFSSGSSEKEEQEQKKQEQRKAFRTAQVQELVAFVDQYFEAAKR